MAKQTIKHSKQNTHRLLLPPSSPLPLQTTQEPEKYESHFSQYHKAEFDPTELEDAMEGVLDAIREDPEHEKKARSKPKVGRCLHVVYTLTTLTLYTRCLHVDYIMCLHACLPVDSSCLVSTR